MRTNRQMAALLEAKPRLAEVEVPVRFYMLVAGGFKRVADCVFFRESFHHDSLSALSLHHDRTGYECAINAVHLDDYLELGAAREPPALAATAVACAELLKSRLSKLDDGDFRIIATVRGDGSTLRFHKLRPGESWIDDDLDGYLEEAVFVLDALPRPA